MSEKQHNINESHDKIRLQTKLKRGTGTRDQDTHTLKARGETPAEAAENLDECLSELEERGFFDRARAVENEDGDSDE
jgi:hypothetical protein